jgi:isopenicillin N synthase-like dioxygenase
MTSHHTLPPFPSDVPTAPLVTLDLPKLLADDQAESAAFFQAAQELGFFYLDMRTSPLGKEMITCSEELRLLAIRFSELPREEKEKYSQESIGPFYAWRYKESNELDAKGNKKYSETYNVSRNGAVQVEEYMVPC